MDSNLTNKTSEVIIIEDDSDDCEKTPAEVISEWDAKIRKKLLKYSVADNETVLGVLMKEYLQSLQEIVRSYEDNEALKKRVSYHMSFLYSYYIELQCCTSDNYLSNMEDILTIYCNLELEVIRPFKKKEKDNDKKYEKRIRSVARRIIHVLTVYLLERQDHILHVLIKMNTKKVTNSCSEVLNILYSHFLTKVPVTSFCDDSFLRSYLVYQKWKEIRKMEDWESMDKFMYKIFKRTPESIKTNETLREILMPARQSTVDIVLNLFRSFRDISNAYFKHVTAKKNVEMDDLDFNIDLGDDDSIVPDIDENDEDIKFLNAYFEIERNMSQLSHTDNAEVDIYRKYKEEIEDDDDVLFVDSPESPTLSLLDDENFIPMACNTNDTSFISNENEESTSLKEKSSALENLNCIARICVGSPRTVSESSILCQTSEIPTRPPTPVLPSIKEVISASELPLETNQPEVSLVSNITQMSLDSNITQIPYPSPENISEQVCENATKTIEIESVEIQADNYNVYNDYGLTTPPSDEHRTEENAGNVCGKSTKTLQVQGEEISYNFGLTPPNDTEDHGARLQKTCLYTNIGQHKDLSEEKSAEQKEVSQVAQEDIEVETNNPTVDIAIIPSANVSEENIGEVSDPGEFDEPESQIDISEMPNIEEEIDIETDQEQPEESHTRGEIRINPELQNQEYNSFKTSDQIDTGQKSISNTAPNIDTKETEIFNGSSVLKPLLSPNRTNGQTKDTPTSPKILFTSSQKIHGTSLDEFSRFESAMHKHWDSITQDTDFDNTDVVGNVNPFEDSNPKAAANSSRSNSPAEMTSPTYEGIDDLRNHFNEYVNGRVPPPHDVKVPKGILKKTNNNRLYPYIKVPKRVLKDPKIKMNTKVEIEKLPFVDNTIRNMINARTLRVDYDKSTTSITERDVVRHTSPPRLTWKVTTVPSKYNQGKVKSSVDAYCKKVSSQCEKNQSLCCNQLAQEFTKLNCNVTDDKALNLTIPEIPPPVNPETEFSNSPTFLQGTDELVQHCLEETSKETPEVHKPDTLLCDNSNFYKSCSSNSSSSKRDLDENNESNKRDLNENNESNLKEIDDDLLKLPTAVPESYDFDKNLKNEVFSKIDWQNFEDSDGETRLPLKKRKLSVKNEDEKKEEISYPATPMISIAEVEDLHLRKLETNNTRAFKTPAERKEMPPLPILYNVEAEPSPIITDQFNINNHTYNNPTINYHMNNVPVPFINIPCGSYYSLPPILVPFNNVSNFEQAKGQQQQETFVKKENRKQGRQRRRH